MGNLKEKCGKIGCDKVAVGRVWGSLVYWACVNHIVEIQELVRNE